ncbi:MAG: SAM-dependent methyltransferase, partial [Bdellovibrionota bacterium]
MATLYLVATPIGNLEDLSPRAVEVLGQADLIAAEDTRHTRKLLSAMNIPAPRLASYYEPNEKTQAVALADELDAGRDVALVSDAGTPGISDPGYRVVCLAIERGHQVVP